MYKRLTCTAGLSPRLSVSPKTGLKGKVAATVRGDGKALFESGPITGGEAAFDIDVSVEGVRELELLVKGLHRTTDDFWLGHFIWARPRLEKANSH